MEKKYAVRQSHKARLEGTNNGELIETVNELKMEVRELRNAVNLLLSMMAKMEPLDEEEELPPALKKIDLQPFQYHN